MEQMKATPSLSFSQAINQAANNILKFNGRARRSEYWWTMAVVYLVSLVLTPLAGSVLNLLTIPLTFRRLHDSGRSGWWWGCGAILQGIVFILLFCDLISFIFQAGFSGGLSNIGFDIILTWLLKYSLLSILIFIYEVVLIILCCIDSDPYENKYGKSPKYVPEETII